MVRHEGRYPVPPQGIFVPPQEHGANQQRHATAGTLVNPVSGKCLDDPRFNTTPGTRLELYTCNGGANQQWKIP